MSSERSRWVVSPTDKRIEIQIGPEAKLSPELRGALDQLAKALEEQDEVQGYMHCLDVNIKECLSYITCGAVCYVVFGHPTPV